MPTDEHSTHRAANPLDRLGSNWNRFWFASCHLHTLGLLRACFGFTLVLRITGTTGLFRIGAHTAQFPDRSLWPVRQMLDTFHALRLVGVASTTHTLLVWQTGRTAIGL